MEEWIELKATGTDNFDITNWKIGTKTFLEKKENLYSHPADSLSIQENKIEITFPESGEVWLWWDKSPISLPNNGDTIQIKNETGKTVDEIIYPETKSGTKDGNEYTDIWNRNNPQSQDICALRYQENHSYFVHSQGKKNQPCPTKAEFLLSEASPQNIENDFLEIIINKANQDEINLKYLEVKHNGTRLFHIETDYWVNKNDILVVEFNDTPFSITQNENRHTITTAKKDGLSAGSGTIEIKTHSNTSQEKTTDVLCWKDEQISQTESNRVEKWRDQNIWDGDCIEIKDLIKNESIARENQTDTNTKYDFFRHFNGSKGLSNNPQNSPPKAVITAQGSYIQTNDTLNFTGEDSTDPDGKQDIKTYHWTLNEKTCPIPDDGWSWSDNCDIESQKENPKTIYFTQSGDYTITLTITDYSGESHTSTTEITVTEQGINTLSHGSQSTTFQKNIQKWVQKELNKKVEKTKKTPNNENSFWNEFLTHIEPQKINNIIQTPPPIPEYLKPQNTIPPPARKKRDRFTKSQQKRISKNMGLIFEPKYLYP